MRFDLFYSQPPCTYLVQQMKVPSASGLQGSLVFLCQKRYSTSIFTLAMYHRLNALSICNSENIHYDLSNNMTFGEQPPLSVSLIVVWSLERLGYDEEQCFLDCIFQLQPLARNTSCTASKRTYCVQLACIASASRLCVTLPSWSYSSL